MAMFRGGIRIGVLLLALAFSPALQSAVEWQNLDEQHHLGGCKTSAGYLLGKVVMVNLWSLKIPDSCEPLPVMENHWQSFRNQDFVLLSGHRRDFGSKNSSSQISEVPAKVKYLAKVRHLTYPIYEGAGLMKQEPSHNGLPLYYVVDPFGNVIYRGRNDRLAVDMVVGALAKWESPSKLQDWRNDIEFEIANLPAHAILRYEAFKRAFPLEAENYKPQVRALAKLPGMGEQVALLRATREIRSALTLEGKQKAALRTQISKTTAKYQHLKDSSDPQLSREAKNALADLKWAQAEL